MTETALSTLKELVTEYGYETIHSELNKIRIEIMRTEHEAMRSASKEERENMRAKRLAEIEARRAAIKAEHEARRAALDK